MLEDIRNHIYTAKQGLEFSKLDQDNLSAKIKNWKEQNSTVSHYFRPYLKEESTLLLTGTKFSDFSELHKIR